VRHARHADASVHLCAACTAVELALLTAAAACPSSRGVVRQLMERAPPDKLPNEIEDLGFVGMITWHQRSQVLPPPVCHLGMYVCINTYVFTYIHANHPSIHPSIIAASGSKLASNTRMQLKVGRRALTCCCHQHQTRKASSERYVCYTYVHIYITS